MSERHKYKLKVTVFSLKDTKVSEELLITPSLREFYPNDQIPLQRARDWIEKNKTKLEKKHQKKSSVILGQTPKNTLLESFLNIKDLRMRDQLINTLVILYSAVRID